MHDEVGSGRAGAPATVGGAVHATIERGSPIGSPDPERTMKGTIVVCLKELVEKRFGKPAWESTIAAAGVPGQIFLAPADVPDETVMKILAQLSKVTNTPAQALMDAFGDYWANEYATRVYASYYRQHETAMDFLLGVDALHTSMTKTIPNAHPPHFTYERKGDRSFIMTYASPRKLGALVPGLVRGVARRYGARCIIRELGGDRFEISFP